MILQSIVFNQQIGNGLIMMVLGMGIVFLFLTILVFSTKIISKIVTKMEKKSTDVPNSKATQSLNHSTSAQEAEIAAAIAVAYDKAK